MTIFTRRHSNQLRSAFSITYRAWSDPTADPLADLKAAQRSVSDGTVTGSIARAGSFKGSALIVPPGVDAGLIAVAFRGRGIFTEGPIPVPAAATVQSEPTEEPAQA